MHVFGTYNRSGDRLKLFQHTSYSTVRYCKETSLKKKGRTCLDMSLNKKVTSSQETCLLQGKQRSLTILSS